MAWTHSEAWIWLRVVMLATGTFLLLSLLWRILSTQLESWSRKTPCLWDDLLLQAIRPVIWVLILLGAMTAGLSVAPEPVKSHGLLIIILKLGLIILTLWAVDRIARSLLRNQKVTPKLSKNSRILSLTVLRVILACLGIVMILDTIGIKVTPLLASLGIGSLAVALALQDTLGNLFSGFYLLIDQPIRLGDFVKLEEGIEGSVTKIGWRSTQLSLSSNDLVIIPNSKLAGSRIINYSLPDPESSVLVEFSVSDISDLDHVEKVCKRTASEILATVPGGISEYQPRVRFHSIADSSINFTVILRARQVSDGALLKHEFIKKLLTAFRTEGIALPTPNLLVQVKKTGTV